jgi:zinc and cadmium transporter
MITNYLYAILSVVLVGLVSFIGVFSLAIKESVLKKYIGCFIGLAIGALLGGAFVHIIPEAFESGIGEHNVSLLIIAGILVFFVIEKFIHWHHHGEDCEDSGIHPAGKMILLTDGFHNFIDGIIIGASFFINIPLGIATTIAVILHEIPQEVGDFAVLIHSGFSKKKALLFNFLSATTAILGTIVVIIFGSIVENFALWLMPIAAGGFIYVAVADLIPILHKSSKAQNSILQLLFIGVGIFAMIFLAGAH